ncbi:response regulator transcription factor [Haloglycomyces albus]|uniref:response regulator transcription factor n=1 Tax=Haloglycomyces albus TaxID=526067 RepID=UPI00046D2423|nr:response regulator transcription factor [Haloglycomyces albus]
MRVIIAEDDALLREGLSLILQTQGHEVLTAVSNADAFLEAVADSIPDAAIVDVRMPPTHTDEGVRAAVEARRRIPGLAVLVLSAYVEQSFATDLLAEGSRGIGYLLKERVGRVEAFTEALDRVAGGGTAIDPEVVAQLFARSPVADLTAREGEVLRLMAEGLGNPAIAGRLYISDNTVHKHIRAIFRKLDLGPTADRRVAAVLRYLETR